jgi:hypothetical protein
VIPRLAKRQVARELLFCHCASRKRSEYVTCAAVRRECLRRRQLAFIGPPAPVLFHELPSLIYHRDLPQSSSASRFTAGAARLDTMLFDIHIGHEQPVGHRLLKSRITCASVLGIEVASTSPSLVLNSTT